MSFSCLYVKIFILVETFLKNKIPLDLLPELMSIEPRLEISHEKIIVIDNIPKVGVDKKDKLKKILQNLLNTYGKITNEYYPEGKNDDTHLSVLGATEIAKLAVAQIKLQKIDLYKHLK